MIFYTTIKVVKKEKNEIKIKILQFRVKNEIKCKLKIFFRDEIIVVETLKVQSNWAFVQIYNTIWNWKIED